MNKNLLQEAYQQLTTIYDFIRFAASRFEESSIFYGHGTDNVWDEAIALVLATISLPHDTANLFFQTKLIDSEKKAILDRIEIRIDKRLPLPYILNEAWFAGMSFYVDERVLIPRSPIAELIQQRFQSLIDIDNIENIADVCTGSACIACALAEYFPEAKVDALDLSAQALEVAKLNIEKHGLKERVRAIKSDLLTNVLGKKYDLIIANPPYVANDLMQVLPKEYLAEPKMALSAGSDGLDFVLPILEQAKKCLSSDGLIIIEVGSSKQALEGKYPKVPFLWLEFEHGGEGVFALTLEQIKEFF